MDVDVIRPRLRRGSPRLDQLQGYPGKDQEIDPLVLRRRGKPLGRGEAGVGSGTAVRGSRGGRGGPFSKAPRRWAC